MYLLQNEVYFKIALLVGFFVFMLIVFYAESRVEAGEVVSGYIKVYDTKTHQLTQCIRVKDIEDVHVHHIGRDIEVILGWDCNNPMIFKNSYVKIDEEGVE